MPRVKKEKEETEIIEEDSKRWYCVKGFTPPEKWDWKLIRKEWNRLKMPKDLAYDIFHMPLSYEKRCGYYMLLSKRGIGKSTSAMLLGLILFKLYGVQIQYIRENEDMLKPKNAQELMSVILSCGYIKTLTDGRWNYAHYYGNRWVFANIDDNGKIVEKTGIHFCYTLSIDQSFVYKSNYNAPHGDMTIFDEFIGKRYAANSFVYYMDILSTIIRKRSGVLNFLLSNNIDEFSEYFEEFEIYEQIREMKAGECSIATTPGGTRVYVEKINIHDKNAARLNKEYFGFKNPRLYAITGAGEWNVALCKHYDLDDETELIDRTHYIKMGMNLVNIELHRSKKYGMLCRVHKATQIHEDSIVYTMDEIEDKRFRKGKGRSNVDHFIWGLLVADKWHYATNSQKNFVDKYNSICYGYK